MMLRIRFDAPAAGVLERLGELPLPPYIQHQPDQADEARYQTVFARVPGAVAAPTAGLPPATMTSTFSSETNFLAFFTAVVVSEASSSRTIFTFWPAMVAGTSATVLGSLLMRCGPSWTPR